MPLLLDSQKLNNAKLEEENRATYKNRKKKKHDDNKQTNQDHFGKSEALESIDQQQQQPGTKHDHQRLNTRKYHFLYSHYKRTARERKQPKMIMTANKIHKRIERLVFCFSVCACKAKKKVVTER
jgi:hypothetical protein